VVVATVSLPPAAYPEPAHVHAFYDDVLQRLRSIRGVTRASIASFVPFYTDAGIWDFDIEGRAPVEAGQPALNAGVGSMRAGFLDLMGIPLRNGRTFTEADRAGAEPVVVINEALADKFLAGGNPIGQRMRIASDRELAWMRIVGIVGNVRDGHLESPPQPMYYFPHQQDQEPIRNISRTMAIAVRVAGSPDPAVTALRNIVRAKDPSLSVSSVQTLTEAVGGALARRRFATSLFGSFAVIGLLLGATGIYGVLAYVVSQRTREIGIRRALGASSRAVASAAVGQAVWPVAAGLGVGLFAAAGLSRWIEGQLFGVTGTDTTTYVTVMACVSLVALAACLIPLRRALRIDPAIALQE
jgi:predicted permease